MPPLKEDFSALWKLCKKTKAFFSVMKFWGVRLQAVQHWALQEENKCSYLLMSLFYLLASQARATTERSIVPSLHHYYCSIADCYCCWLLCSWNPKALLVSYHSRCVWWQHPTKKNRRPSEAHINLLDHQIRIPIYYCGYGRRRNGSQHALSFPLTGDTSGRVGQRMACWPGRNDVCSGVE